MVAAAIAFIDPVYSTVQSWQRGLLMVVKNTKHIYWEWMGVNLMATGLALGNCLKRGDVGRNYLPGLAGETCAE